MDEEHAEAQTGVCLAPGRGHVPTNNPPVTEGIPVTYNTVCNWEISKYSERSFNSHSSDRVGQFYYLFPLQYVCL